MSYTRHRLVLPRCAPSPASLRLALSEMVAEMGGDLAADEGIKLLYCT